MYLSRLFIGGPADGKRLRVACREDGSPVDLFWSVPEYPKPGPCYSRMEEVCNPMMTVHVYRPVQLFSRDRRYWVYMLDSLAEDTVVPRLIGGYHQPEED
jgi:hypothetical protein